MARLPKPKPKQERCDSYLKAKKAYLEKFEISRGEREFFERFDIYYNELLMDNFCFDELSKDEVEAKMPESVLYPEEYYKALKAVIPQLTERQQELVLGYLDGKTQSQLAKELGINQSSVSLAWSGSKNYTKCGERGKVYGGIIKKLAQLITDELIKEALRTK